MSNKNVRSPMVSSLLFTVRMAFPGIILMAASACIAQTFPPLPQGNTGIASRHPGDAGIAGDTAVVYADDFESYTSSAGLQTNWNGGVYHYVNIVTATAKVFAGKQAIEMRSPQQTTELSNTVARQIDNAKQLDCLFLRYYTQFDPSFNISGSCHNGGGMSASYFVNGNATPGIPADGYNKFLAEFESWRGDSTEPNPGNLNVYVYHPTQRSQWGDHWFPDGIVLPWTYLPGDFGTSFVSRPKIVCQLGKWYCCELMIKANTPGVKDGRIACWLDGVLIADFMNLRLRDTDTLKIDRFNLSLHSGSNPKSETFKYYDNVVAAKSYIGPMYTPGSVRYQPDKGRFPNLSKPSMVGLEIYTLQGKPANIPGCRTFKTGGIYLTRVRTGENTATTIMAVTR